MAATHPRGGIPRVFRGTIDATGREVPLKFVCQYLIIRVTTAACRLYFTEQDYDDGVNYVLVPVPAASTPHGEWQGPVQADRVWLKGDVASADVEMVTFQQLG